MFGFELFNKKKMYCPRLFDPFLSSTLPCREAFCLDCLTHGKYSNEPTTQQKDGQELLIVEPGTNVSLEWTHFLTLQANATYVSNTITVQVLPGSANTLVNVAAGTNDTIIDLDSVAKTQLSLAPDSEIVMKTVGNTWVRLV